ncbi:MAG: response regulator [Pseudomonadales bacterium]|nr:response regulator [Pseudomonadales bacterium]NRA17080.1 response regulator [Oceanospirillaceae bacterium]
MTTIAPWKVLVVDDDEGIHSITRMVFRGYQFENRPIELINALSGAKAREVLAEQTDIAVAILDVVMETDSEGLDLVNFIRQQLNNHDLRIILRTGHPGFAPEAEVIIQYDINDYLGKAELSASRLITSVVVALRSYRDIQSVKSQSQPRLFEPRAELNQRRTNSVACQALLTQVSGYFAQKIQPIVTDSQRLLQFQHKPMLADLVATLNNRTEQLQQLNLLLQDNAIATESGSQQTILATLLDNILRQYTAQARAENWIIDYQIDSQLTETIGLSETWLRSVLMTLLEQAICLAAKTDLSINLSLQQQRLCIEIVGDSSDREQNSSWSQCLDSKLEQLSQSYQGRIEDSNSSLVSYSCQLP